MQYAEQVEVTVFKTCITQLSNIRDRLSPTYESPTPNAV